MIVIEGITECEGNMKTQKYERVLIYIFFWLFMCIGIVARVCGLGDVPADINVDEAFSGYEAYSLLHYGMDSHGYRFPVYLTTWGSGMSALNSYLMIPFIATFGAETWVIRIPQLLVGCITLCVVYHIVKRVINKYAALCTLFLLAVSPWHIMMSRWALDANLAVGFVVFGFYFFLRGMEKNSYFLLAGLMYGLSLYCYATIWPFVPVMLILQLGYGFYYKKICWSKNLLLGGVVVFVFAVPLLLFLMVNFGWIDEICLPFISIPKLLYMRAGEFSLENLYEKMRNLWHIVKLQNDWHPWNVTEAYGIYYHCSFPFFIIGLFVYLKESVLSIFKKKYCPHIMVLIQLSIAVLLGLMIEVNVNRVNILFIPMIIIAASGIYYVCIWVEQIVKVCTKKDLRKAMLIIPMCCYLVLFVQFEKYYFTEYKDEIAYSFCGGIEDAVNCAMQYEGIIYVSPGIEHSRILFYSKQPVTEYLETVEYINYPSSFVRTSSFGRFRFEFDATQPDTDAIYILNKSVDLTRYEEMGFEVESFEWFDVAHVE